MEIMKKGAEQGSAGDVLPDVCLILPFIGRIDHDLDRPYRNLAYRDIAREACLLQSISDQRSVF